MDLENSCNLDGLKNVKLTMKEIREITTNRKASFNYTIGERLEAGIVLLGSEIKSICNGKVSIGESYVIIEDNEAFIIGMHVAEFKQASVPHEPLRKRKLLLKKKEIKDLHAQTRSGGTTVVPIRLYISKKGMAKLEIAVCKGRKNHDKRLAIKTKDLKRAEDRGE